MNEIEEIKQRLDLVDLIGQYVTLKKAGANYKGQCPFHQEKTASLMVSPQKQIWKCFGCGKGGDHYEFVMEAEHLEFGDALKLLSQKAGVTLQPRTQAEHQTQNRKDRLFRINELSARVFQKVLLESAQGKPALAYLEKRGLRLDTIKQFRIGFASRTIRLQDVAAKHQITPGDLAQAGHPEKFYERIIFPIFDVLAHVIAFTGRAMGDSQPKYLNSPETALYSKSRVLYGLNFAKGAIKDKNQVILVEGQMDVISLHQAGIAQTVASSGTAITEAQIQILSKYTPNFVLAFDNDSAGKTTTKKVIELLLKNDLNGKVIDFSPYKDAGELFEKAAKDWPDKAKSATEMVEWWLQQEIATIGELHFIENKKAIVKTMLPVLQLITDATRRDHYVARLSAVLETKPESIYQSLEKAAVKTEAAAPNQPKASSAAKLHLTNEEQLLTIFLFHPELFKKYKKEFDEVVWQSIDVARIVDQVKIWYTNDTLVKNQTQFLSQVKTPLDSQLAEKIDSWLFWLTATWENLPLALAEDLVKEKLTQLTSRKYEQQKESLALKIRAAQERGDLSAVKELMVQLNTMTKEGGRT